MVGLLVAIAADPRIANPDIKEQLLACVAGSLEHP